MGGELKFLDLAVHLGTFHHRALYLHDFVKALVGMGRFTVMLDLVDLFRGDVDQRGGKLGLRTSALSFPARVGRVSQCLEDSRRSTPSDRGLSLVSPHIQPRGAQP